MTRNNYDYCLGTANRVFRNKITAILSEAGFYCSGEGKNVAELLRTLRTVQPWLAVIDTGLPPGNVEQLASIIEDDALAAALYINTGITGPALYVQLKWPVEDQVLTAVAEAMCSEFARKKRLQKELETLQNKLSDRKVIEKAKGIIAKVNNLSEEEAYTLLRKSSMKKRITVKELSNRIITDPGYLSV